MDEKKYLTERQVYNRIGVSRTTLRRWVREGNFPSAHKLRKDGRIGYLLSEVLEWENSRNRSHPIQVDLLDD